MERKLSLVGAGPGDPDLISIKGVKTLAEANVVLYDALIHPDLLAYAPKEALKIYVGKRAGNHSYSQEEINRLIINYSFSHGHVVRLKGGDPFIFARGKEEIDYAAGFGIKTQVVPGISSINLAGLYGLPLTLRGKSESFWVVTASSKSGRLAKDVQKVVESSATAVFLMGLSKAANISSAYKKRGKGWMPAAIISNGSLADARVFSCYAENLAQTIQKNQIAAPSIILVGEAIAESDFFAQTVNEKYHVSD